MAIQVNKNLTVFIEATAWGKLAEFIARHFKKGDELFIEGVLAEQGLPSWRYDHANTLYPYRISEIYAWE